MVDKRVFHKSILDWYRVHKRSLPWRNDTTPNPYHIWLSEIMLQQTRVVTVLDYFNHFTARWKTLEALAKADEQEVLTAWAGLGYYSRARNLIKCAKEIMAHHGGKIPDTIEELEALPGIGKYTAAAIAAIAYGKPTTPIDGNIERIMARVYAITTPLPKAKKELWQKAQDISPKKKSGEWAQALMDMGTIICTPKTPKCPLCPIENHCQAQKQNLANKLPIRSPRKKKPTRYTTAYVIENHKGELLLEKRKEKGLLGGMTGFPTTEWQEKKSPQP
ncbi:MAG: A/G-specific adenine glycosylase, partial [Parvibaculales bacterium]